MRHQLLNDICGTISVTGLALGVVMIVLCVFNVKWARRAGNICGGCWRFRAVHNAADRPSL